MAWYKFVAPRIWRDEEENRGKNVRKCVHAVDGLQLAAQH